MMRSPLLRPNTGLLCATVLVLSAGAFTYWYRTDHVPRASEVRHVENHAALLSSRNQQTRTMISSLGLKRLEETLVQLATQAEQLERLIPADTAPDGVLRTVTEVTRRHGVQLVDLAPAEPWQPAPSASGGPALTSAAYRVTTRGGYHATAAVLADLLSQDRVMQVRQLAFEAVALNDDSDGGAGRVPGWGVEAKYVLHALQVRTATAPSSRSPIPAGGP